MRATIRAWLLAAILVPMVLVLATATVVLGPSVALPRHPPAAAPPAPGAAGSAPAPSPQLSADLVIDSTASPAGGPPLTVTVRITIDPPVLRVRLERARSYVTHLVETLVKSPPKDWAPDAEGRAALKQAIEEAVPVSVAPLLPAGTRVQASAEVAPAPAAPAPEVSPTAAPSP